MGSISFCDSNGSKCFKLLLLLLNSCYLVICLHSVTASGNDSISIGALIDFDSRAGREQKIAMMMAAESFNRASRNQKLALHFQNISQDPIQAVSAARTLITEKQVQVIIGLCTWEQVSLVADVVDQAQVPIISLAASSNAPNFVKLRWPFLIPMAPNSLEQINCIAAMVRSYNWRKVIVIYEENFYGGDSGMIAPLSEALQDANAEIESHLAVPPPSSIVNFERILRDEIAKLLRYQSRVFIVLRASSSLATPLFKEAEKLGLMGRDSVWIIADTISDLLDYADSSFISSAQGALGIKKYYSDDNPSFLDFKRRFQSMFRAEFSKEDSMEVGIHALQAYDGVTAISKAVEKISGNSNANSTSLLKLILSSNFSGLTGDIMFHNGALAGTSVFKIVNVIGKRYKELGFWSLSFGFSGKLNLVDGKLNLNATQGLDSMQELNVIVNWPGELSRIPKGWAMPTDAKPMVIGIPGRTSFEKFVKVDWTMDKSDNRRYDGFCIDLFEKVVKILEQDYSLPYEFVPYNGTYDALIDHVINKSFDAVVGDITILANRSRFVDFTQPFAESGLSMLVPVKHESQKTWMFMKPFTINMWIATFGILFYTMFVVWFIEHQQNPEFRGPWKDQLGTSLWFTFSSLFFAHREKIISNYAKVVVVVWLFLVFVLTSSYTASLTSMLTVPRLEPNVTDVEWIRRTNAPVGCDDDSFVKNYLRDVVELRNIKNISKQEDYPTEFASGNITAAFLELPYQKIFLKEHCNEYTVAGPTYRFGGQGFVFQKGSPIARDVSKAILTLSENGKLKRLEDEWLESSMNCTSDGSLETESLRFGSFWGLFLISGGTTTLSFLAFLVHLFKHNAQQHGPCANGSTHRTNGIINKVVELVHPRKARSMKKSMGRAPGFSQRWGSSRWDLVSPSDPSEHFETSPSEGSANSSKRLTS